MQNLAKFSHLIYLVISYQLLRQLATLVFGSIYIFSSLTKSGIPVRLLLFISGISKRLSGYPMYDAALLAANALARSHPFLEDSLLLIVADSSVFIKGIAKIYSLVSHVRKSLHWLLSSIALFSRQQ